MTSVDPSAVSSTTASDSEGISLCLSGGGYRAAIFHLGALRWLNECNVLSRLKTVSCVSGGSVVGAFLAHRLEGRWPTGPIPAADWQAEIVEPFWRFVNRDIRTWPILVRFLWPLNWFRPHATVESLRKLYARRLLAGRDRLLREVTGLPKFVFCATDMVFNVNWESTWQRVGDYQAGYSKPPAERWTMARAVAASSCFPPIFPPAKTYFRPQDLKRGAYPARTEAEKKDRDKKVRQIRLTDGGVYDNLGLEPVDRDKCVLVSDGGGAVEYALVSLPWKRLARYPALLQAAIGKLRKEGLMRDYKTGVKQGTYWGIAGGSARGGVFASGEQAQAIAAIRTDLNRFTRAEFEILENHGYLSAAEKTTAKCPALLHSPQALSSLRPPNPGHWINAPVFQRSLKYSARRFWPYCLR
jgi:NTE family protein